MVNEPYNKAGAALKNFKHVMVIDGTGFFMAALLRTEFLWSCFNPWVNHTLSLSRCIFLAHYCGAKLAGASIPAIKSINVMGDHLGAHCYYDFAMSTRD